MSIWNEFVEFGSAMKISGATAVGIGLLIRNPVVIGAGLNFYTAGKYVSYVGNAGLAYEHFTDTEELFIPSFQLGGIEYYVC
mgnify:CR=1 FL=1|tara:strand:+ start:485 stop:730 length:246 start_codon:yes stop_codon:yes gene_type:complete